MRPINLLALLAAAAAVLSSAGPARAAASATLSLTDFGYTLVDLDPADGVAPAITFSLDPAATSQVVVEASSQLGLVTVGSSAKALHGTSGFAPLGYSVSAPLTSASASLEGSISKLSLLASGAARAQEPVSDDAQFGARISSGSLTFTLTPHTQVVFSGQAFATAQTTVGIGTGPAGPQGEVVLYSLTIQASGVGPFGGGSQSSSDRLEGKADFTFEVDPDVGPIYAGQTVSESRLFGTSFANATAGALSGQLSIEASIEGATRVTAAPVPEPAGLTMMLAGAVLLLGIGRARVA